MMRSCDELWKGGSEGAVDRRSVGCGRRAGNTHDHTDILRRARLDAAGGLLITRRGPVRIVGNVLRGG